MLRYHVENVRGFLDAHWAIRLLVAPVLALAGVLCVAAIATGNVGVATATLVGGYLAFALVAVAIGLGVELLLRRFTDGSLGP
ncbi:hypothetical protein G9C85_11200 [Halorubellus sp. JP-L1]|uniref:hypothetical protein n=1 Tax=Halorubellus sp. JP-L1 TaxID=2715753 RepID=UPI00140AAE2D|nr:hypothetical protein [Halorubellus sp. JP-L1]NHN42188.1 hypothetical protein [Halorubellus sp. JP-L1]